MNTTHTTRTSVRAGALTVLLTGLVLGAPAIASASPAPCVNPRACLHPDVHPAETSLPPTLTGSNSGAFTSPASNVVIFGANFTPNGWVDVAVLPAGGGAPLCSDHLTAKESGAILSPPGCKTGRGRPNAYAVATDETTGKKTNALPVIVTTPGPSA